MKTKTLFASLTLVSMLPLQVIAAGTISVNDTVAGVPVTIGVHGMSQGAYDVVIHPQGGSSSNDIIVPVMVSAGGSADALLRASEVEVAGTYNVTLEQDGTALSPKAIFTIAAGPLDTAQSDVIALAEDIRADGEDNVLVIARAMDGFGNPLSGRPLTLLSSRPTDTVTPDTDETDDNGEQTFTLTTTEEGTVYLRAMDLITGQMFAEGVTINATAWGVGSADRLASVTSGGKTFYYAAQATTSSLIEQFDITGPKRTKADNPLPRITVTAKDGAGKPVISYEGTIICSSTDPEADLPDMYTFLGSERGRHNFDVNFILSTEGPQDIKCEDSENPDIFGTITIDVQGGGGGGHSAAGIILSEPTPDQWINTLEVHVTGEGPELSNIVIDAGDQSAESVTVGSDAQGHFTTHDPEDPTPLMLLPGQTDYTIFVEREDGQGRKTVTVHFDDIAPEIGAVAFAPEEPREGDKVFVEVESEPGINVKMRFPKKGKEEPKELKLTEEEEGVYQEPFDAPATGSYQMDIIATDIAGNETIRRVVLKVGTEGLGTVENLEAEGLAGGKVSLTWDPVEDATGYYIYVASEKLEAEGEAQYVWDEPLQTNKGGRGTPLTAADVYNVPAGATRYFAVTAVQEPKKGDTIESLEKSNVVKVTMQGLTLEATPQDSSVALKWTGLPKDLQLESYLLRYGPAPDDLREMRTIAGKAQSQQVRDLLNDVTYYFELTPITVAGVKIDELAATASATPKGGVGFRPAPADPIPFNIATKAPQTPAHAGAPLEDTGIPSFAWFALILAGLAGTFEWHRRRNIRRTMLLLEQMAKQYHS